MRIEEYGTSALVETEDVSFSFEITENPRDFEKYKAKEDSLNWSDKNYQIGDYIIHPYGDANDLDEQIRQVIQNHYLAPGQLKKKAQMLWGQGPQLYREVIKNGDLVREWVKDKEVWDWIKSFDGEQYLLNCITDYGYAEGAFTKIYRARGSRLGKDKIAKLEHIAHNKARKASKKSNRSDARFFVVTDWDFKHIDSVTNYKVYNAFDFNSPFAHKNSIYYSSMYSFCTDYYTVPDLYGSLEWLRRSTAIPLIFKALSKNSMNIKYHIQSPAAFWEAKRDRLMEQCEEENIKFTEKLFNKYKRNFLQKIADVLTGSGNTGKFWHSEKVINVDGHDLKEQGWDIKTIDQNIKDFISGHIQISDKADRVISASFGLHGALGNVSANGKSDSGSEQVYAFKNYINSGVDIPEMIVCKPMNYALQANFPKKGYKIGFFRSTTQAESEVSPKDRIKNN